MTANDLVTVTVNGSLRPLGQAETLTHLLDALGVKTAKMAVELNGVIIPPSDFSTTAVSSDDRIEIIQFVGGG